MFKSLVLLGLFKSLWSIRLLVLLAGRVSSLSFFNGDDVEGDELDDELDERDEAVGEADDSVLTVVEELVNCGLDWMEFAELLVIVDVIVRGFSRFGRICVEAMDFLRWFNRSVRSLIELEKSLIVGFC